MLPLSYLPLVTEPETTPLKKLSFSTISLHKSTLHIFYYTKTSVFSVPLLAKNSIFSLLETELRV